MKTKDEKAQGCACGADMQKEIKNIVKEGTKPTKTQHDKKQAEVDEAFGKKK